MVLKVWRRQPNLEPSNAHCQRRIKDLHRPHFRAKGQVTIFPIPPWPVAESGGSRKSPQI